MAASASPGFKCGHPYTEDNTVLVRERFRYCRICNRQRANRRYRNKHAGARQKAFLSLDDKIASLLQKTPDHWLWQGALRDGSIAVCYYEGKVHFLAQLLWERERGPVPDGHCLYRICTVAHCVRPRCRLALMRASHITDGTRGVRGSPRDEGGGTRYYGLSPEAAAIFGLIDDAQYLARYKISGRRWKARCGTPEEGEQHADSDQTTR